MHCKSLAVLFLMLSTASSQDFHDFGGQFSPFYDAGSFQGSSASPESIASSQNQNQNYAFSYTDFGNFASEPVPYGLHQGYGQDYAFGNAPSAGITESPQFGAAPSLQPEFAPSDFQGFPPSFSEDGNGPAWQLTDESENSPGFSHAVPSNFPEWPPEDFPGYALGPTTHSENYGNQPSSTVVNPPPPEPAPLAQPPLSPPLFDFPDIPVQPDFLPLGNIPGGGSSSIPDFPPSGFSNLPVTDNGIPFPFPGSTDDWSKHDFYDWPGLGSGNSAGSSSGEYGDTGSIRNCFADDDDDDWDTDDNFGAGYDIDCCDGDNDQDFYDEVGHYDGKAGYGNSFFPWPIANRNFFPGPFWSFPFPSCCDCCCCDCCCCDCCCCDCCCCDCCCCDCC